MAARDVRVCGTASLCLVKDLRMIPAGLFDAGRLDVSFHSPIGQRKRPQMLRLLAAWHM